jgi:hypothetical protein
MDKNDMNDALNHLSGRITAVGQKVGTLRDVQDLRVQRDLLDDYVKELNTIIKIMQPHQ